jgi:hypothetical protein
VIGGVVAGAAHISHALSPLHAPTDRVETLSPLPPCTRIITNDSAARRAPQPSALHTLPIRGVRYGIVFGSVRVGTCPPSAMATPSAARVSLLLAAALLLAGGAAAAAAVAAEEQAAGAFLRGHPSSLAHEAAAAAAAAAAPALDLSSFSAPLAATNGSGSPTIDGHTLPDWFATAAAGIMIPVGLMQVTLGYRLFRVTLLLLGGTAGGVPTFLLAWDNIQDPNAVWIGLGLGVLAGIIAAVASFFLYKVGVFLCGAAMGVVIAVVLNLTVLYKIGGGNTPFIVAAVLLGLGFGALGFYFMRATMISATTTVGAYIFIRSVGYFGGNYPSNEFDIEQELQAGDIADIPWQVYAYFAGWLVLIVVGILVQVKITAKKKDKDEKDEWEVAYDDAELSLDAITGEWWWWWCVCVGGGRGEGQTGGVSGGNCVRAAQLPPPTLLIPTRNFFSHPRAGKKGKKSGKKGKKGKKGGKKGKKGGSKQVRADALLRDYEEGGEFYEDGGYDEGEAYDEGDGGAYDTYDEPPGTTPAGKGSSSGKGGLFAMVSMGSSSGKKGKGAKLPASVEW